MKKLIFLFTLLFAFGCSPDEEKKVVQHQTCYNIIARGYDERGDYIIIKYESFNNKRYSVTNYQDYIGKTQICDLSNLIEQPL